MYQIDSRSAVPVYEQLRRRIILEIVSGKLENGSKLPSIRELATSIRVNPNTVARVYRQLEAEGFVESRKGLGVFIRTDKGKLNEERLEIFRNLTEEYVTGSASIGITAAEMIEYLTGLLKEEIDDDPDE